MKICVDYHHRDLAESLKLLFEKRLGHELYFPHGRSWFTQGYWKIAEAYGDHPSTIDQYLHSPTTERTITLEEFYGFDIIIASYFGNIEPYKRLAKERNCKLIVHMGNAWPVDWSIVDNLLASTKRFGVPGNKNAVFYHQEFDSNDYRYEPPQDSNYIRSFVNCLPTQQHYQTDWADYLQLKQQLPDHILENYGSQCENGLILPPIGDTMRSSKFGLHFKTGGDGFGHVVHNWFSVGRPVIYKRHQYKDCLAGELMIDDVTGFNYDKGGIVEKIRGLSNEEYLHMCEAARKRFDEVVNFDQEEQEIRKFLERLI